MNRYVTKSKVVSAPDLPFKRCSLGKKKDDETGGNSYALRTLLLLPRSLSGLVKDLDAYVVISI